MAVSSKLPPVVRRWDVQLLAALVAAELLLLSVYTLATPAEVTSPRYALYPFVWINVGLWAVMHVHPPVATTRRKIGAGILAAVYLFVLLWVTGLVGFFPSVPSGELFGLSVGFGTPGWERIRLVTPAFYVTFLPFRVIGYLALAYLVYVTLLDAATAAVTGAIGFVSCLSCSFPILASVGSGFLGGAASLSGPLFAYSLDISTVIFVFAVAALFYRPGFDRGSGSDPTQRIE